MERRIKLDAYYKWTEESRSSMFQAVIPVSIYSIWRGENYENYKSLQSVM